jgi:FMN reductase
MIGQAMGIVVATPIYSYDVAPAVRNLVQLTGPAWVRKVVGFMCVAGGPVSYTSVLSLANSLMLDYRSFVLPDFVFASDRSFNQQGQLVNGEVGERIEQLTHTLVRVTEALRNA